MSAVRAPRLAIGPGSKVSEIVGDDRGIRYLQNGNYFYGNGVFAGGVFNNTKFDELKPAGEAPVFEQEPAPPPPEDPKVKVRATLESLSNAQLYDAAMKTAMDLIGKGVAITFDPAIGDGDDARAVNLDFLVEHTTL